MNRAVDALRGSIEVEIECRWPERFMNICAQNGVEFFDLRREGASRLAASMHIGDYRRLRLLAPGGGFTVRVSKKRGAPFFLWRMRRRWALAAALAVCVLAVWASSLFILEIEVEGNESVSDGEILSALDGIGIGIGTMRLSIAQDYVSNEMLQIVPELSWLAINCTGSRARVLVREELPKPEIADKNAPADVVASKAGIISRLVVLEGAASVAVGDAVLAGETLVSGSMDSIPNVTRQVRASAEALARTWYELSMQTPLKTTEKEYTGETKTRTSLIFAGKRINLYFRSGNPWEYCDKITERSEATLFGGAVLPVATSRDVYAEYVPAEYELTPEEAERLLKTRLERRLLAELGERGEPVSLEYSSSSRDGVITATLYAECIERIDKTKEYDAP